MRIGVNIPDDLYQRMKHIKHTVNVSQVCREAIEAYVEDYERARARLESDGADEVVKRLSGEEEHRTVDWEELGWKDARDWVERVDPRQFRAPFSQDRRIGEAGTPDLDCPSPLGPRCEDLRREGMGAPRAIREANRRTMGIRPQFRPAIRSGAGIPSCLDSVRYCSPGTDTATTRRPGHGNDQVTKDAAGT